MADQAQAPPWGTVLTEPLERYTRYNQTSSTTGRPLRWLDTTESWQWMLDCWQAVYRGAGVGAGDRIFFPFSFGPFLGFWTAFDAATQLGAHAIPAGGMTSHQRLALIDALAPTVVCCTPTYALRLLDVAREAGGGDAALAATAVRTIIVAGEPGGSIPATRRRIERGWGARIIDHHGLTEVGPISFECREAPGFLHVNEQEYIAEVLDPESGQPVEDGNRGELVVTNLGRTASPLIRYRTRDLVVATHEPCACGRTFVRLVGGILARADDMVTIRGANVYPTAVEEALRAIDAVVEYRCTVRTGRLHARARRGSGGRPGRRRGRGDGAGVAKPAGSARPERAGHAGRRRHAAALRDEGAPIRRGTQRSVVACLGSARRGAPAPAATPRAVQGG